MLRRKSKVIPFRKVKSEDICEDCMTDNHRRHHLGTCQNSILDGKRLCPCAERSLWFCKFCRAGSHELHHERERGGRCGFWDDETIRKKLYCDCRILLPDNIPLVHYSTDKIVCEWCRSGEHSHRAELGGICRMEVHKTKKGRTFISILCACPWRYKPGKELLCQDCARGEHDHEIYGNHRTVCKKVIKRTNIRGRVAFIYCHCPHRAFA